MTTTPATTAAPAHEELCICGHLHSNHADPAGGDTRCLAVEDRRDLPEAFDDGRDRQYAYCACLHFLTAPRRPAGRSR